MPKPCEEEAVLLAKRLVHRPTMGQMERIRKALVEAEERGRRKERKAHNKAIEQHNARVEAARTEEKKCPQ